MEKVKGVGGIFFKSKDVPKLREWYRDNLGFVITEWGSSMVWTDPKTNQIIRTEWSPMKESSDYYAPSTLPYMINYLVYDLHALVGSLKKDGIDTIGDVNDSEYGKFAWIMDPEGRKIELYQPADSQDGDMPPVWTEKVIGLGGIFLKSNDPVKTKEWYKKHLDVDVNLLENNDKIFSGTDKPYVFKYRVRDLKQFKSETVMDPDGNKILLSQS